MKVNVTWPIYKILFDMLSHVIENWSFRIVRIIWGHSHLRKIFLEFFLKSAIQKNHTIFSISFKPLCPKIFKKIDLEFCTHPHKEFFKKPKLSCHDNAFFVPQLAHNVSVPYVPYRSWNIYYLGRIYSLSRFG